MRFFSGRNSGTRSKLMQNRFDLARERLEMDRWRRLFQEVKAWKPDYVILIARKIPRIYQLMRSFPGTGAPELSVYSDLAISHLPGIANARVAVVDDVINVGTTVAMAADRLKKKAKAREVRCYALERRQNPRQLNIRDYADGMEYESLRPILESEYRESTKERAKSLMLLDRPFEICFPVFRLMQKGGFNLASFKKGLANFKETVHRLDEPASTYIGLTRYSIDMNATRGVNDKWRFYIDEAREEICFAPMLQMFSKNVDYEDVYGGYDTLYAASLNFGNASLPLLKEKLGIVDMRLIVEETERAFGTRLDSPVRSTREALGLKAMLERKTESGGNFLASWHESQIIEHPCVKDDNANVEDCVISFFNKLGEVQRCDDPDIANSSLERLYGRLRRGPSFQELVAIIGDKLKPSSWSHSRLHWQVSQILDEQIDQGFVVPTISPDGERVFRKGEPAPYSRMDVMIARSLGLSDKAGENWRLGADIDEPTRKEFEEIRSQLQKRENA